MASGQLYDPIGHGVDEVAVVADEQQSTGPRREVPFQPGDRVNVEMVGGLVQQQDVRLRHEQPGQSGPHPPTPRQLGHRPAGVVGPEAETGQHLGHPGLQPVAAELLELRLHRAVAGDQVLVVVVVSILVAQRQPFLEVAEGSGKFSELAHPGHRVLADGAFGSLGQVLRQVANACAAGFGDRSCVGFCDPRKHFQQRCLARSVAADQRDPSPGRQVQGHIVEQPPGAVGLGQSGRGEHHRPTLRPDLGPPVGRRRPGLRGVQAAGGPCPPARISREACRCGPRPRVLR